MSERSGFDPGAPTPPISRRPPPLPPSSGRGAQPPLPPRVPQRPKKSLKWLWILLSVGAVLFLAVLGGIGYFIDKYGGLARLAYGLSGEQVEVSEDGLLESRRGHVTEWRESEFEASGPADEPPGEVFNLIRYPSPAGELSAYLSPDPGDGERHPAMIWAKGGFGGIGSFFWEESTPDNDQSARAFREAGMVMMCPSWRGENDNPGRFELFMGEVDDLLAAIEFARTLPYVDPDRIYLGGHSTGGTMALLAAVSGADVRATFSFGGAPDMVSVMSDGDGYGNTPYDPASQIDNELRSAIRYTPYINHPVFYFEGGYSAYQESAAEMEFLAQAHEVPFRAFELPGDHFDILSPITSLVAGKILADTGADCGIEFSEKELEKAWRDVHDMPVAETLEKWIDEGGNLEEMLGELGSDVEADDLEDVKVMRQVIRSLVDEEGDEAARDLAAAVRPIRPSMDDEVLYYFDLRIVGLVRDWLREKASSSDSLSEDVEAAMFDVLETLIYNIDDDAGALVLELTNAGFAPDDWAWGQVFDILDPEDGIFEEVVAGLKKSPPSGRQGERWLNRINRLFFDEGWEGENPFNTAVGKERLREMLGADSEFAYSAGFGLAFVDDETREGLVEYGLEHPSGEIRIEVAWADVTAGGKTGSGVLKEACSELEWSSLAVEYLDELDLGELVPEIARSGEFAAKAKMVSWLKHPNELGGMPTTIELHDTRELFWPPNDEKTPVWLFSFTYRFEESEPLQTAYGMVGGMTWSSFKEYETPPSAAELYAHHCSLEMARHEGMDEEEEQEFTADDALQLLREKNPGAFPE